MHHAHRLPHLILLSLTACPASAVVDDPQVDATTTHDLTGLDPPGPTPTTTDDPTTTTSSSSTADITTTTADTTTGTTAATTAATMDTTGAPAGCGDGEVGPGEACDLGSENNSDLGPCTLHCQENVCGDGLVHLGVEACDDGVDNSDFFYGGCGTQCEFTSYCGDGQVNGPEECDRGEKNGTGDKDADAVPCSATCNFQSLLVFLSSRTYTVPELGGGASQADLRCEELAAAAMLPNHMKFLAWISDKNSSPATRFSPPVPGLAYALKNGLRVADDRTQLLTSGPLTGITITETGATIYKAWVWTNTKQAGTLLDDTLDCEDWTSESALTEARVGLSGFDKQDVDAWKKWKSQQQWTSAFTLPCNKAYHIYCVEQ